MMDDYNYINALWSHFYGTKPKDPVSDELHHHISGQLDTDLRKQLLKLVDCQSAHTELVSLESFAAGFRLATGIAMELAGKWYSFEKEEERRAGK